MLNKENYFSVSQKGQAHFKKEMMDHLGVKNGDRISVGFLSDGRLILSRPEFRGNANVAEALKMACRADVHVFINDPFEDYKPVVERLRSMGCVIATNEAEREMLSQNHIEINSNIEVVASL